MAVYRTDAVVLRTWKLGEADRIVSLLTSDRGKVRAVAKGVRKPRSRFGGRIQPTWHLRLQCYEGRSLDTITQVDTLDSYPAVCGDLDRFTKAAVLLEASEQVCQEGQPDPRMYEMLVGALGELERADSPALVTAYLLKLLVHEGVGPVLDACVVTGAADDDLTHFDVLLGGTVSEAAHQGRRISPEALDLLRRTLGGGLNGVLVEPESAATHEASDLATRLFEHHVERRLRAAHVFDMG